MDKKQIHPEIRFIKKMGKVFIKCKTKHKVVTILLQLCTHIYEYCVYLKDSST